jgi:hypothetical protein
LLFSSSASAVVVSNATLESGAATGRPFLRGDGGIASVVSRRAA